jgi:hypothetical protein
MIRPHPMEKEAVIKKHGLNIEGIVIDDSDDLYGRLAVTDTVIGEISTVLFVAVGLSKKIFVISNSITLFNLPDCPFDQFETVDQLIAMLSDNSKGKIYPIAKESFWANNWEANYRNFIQKKVGLKLK